MGIATTTKTWPAVKDPQDYKDYGIDWTKALAGDPIVSSTWDIAVGDGTLTIDTLSFTNTLAILWINGGTADVDYDLHNHIVTEGNRQFDRTVRLRVKDQ